VSAFGLSLSQYAYAIVCEVDVPPILSIEADTESLTLSFSDFAKGSRSNTQLVAYRVRANTMSHGRVLQAVSARLSESFSYADLEADVEGYRNLGENNFASLEEARSGFQPIKTTETPLANKRPGEGWGDRCLDGQLLVVWQATLTQDAPAGTQNRSLIVTLRDGA